VESAETTRATGDARRDERVLDLARLVVGIGALALLVSLFLDWYGADRFGAAITAWTSFELVDLLLAGLAVAVLGTVAEGVAMPAREPRLPPALLWFGGPFALVLVLASIINPPPLVAGVDPTLEVGIWIALAGALVMMIGIAVSVLRISVVVGGRERDRAAAGPAGETRTMPTEPAEPASGPDPRVSPPR
jgi:hypothetical protein